MPRGCNRSFEPVEEFSYSPGAVLQLEEVIRERKSAIAEAKKQAPWLNCRGKFRGRRFVMLIVPKGNWHL
jgi:hypothetical protein